ncbi:MAG: S41 family peptidase [Flavobacteriales bacterium]
MPNWTSLLIILLIWSGCLAQDCQTTFQPKKELVAKTYLCPEAMQEDLAQLHKHILETHPNPTYYGNINDLSIAYQTAKASVNEPRTVYEFMVVVNQYLLTLKDSHTGINPKQFLYNVNGKRQVLPFFVDKIDNHFYISSAYNDSFIVGAELLQIDSYTPAQLYQSALALSLTEGNATAARDEIAVEYMGLVYNLLSMSLSESKTAQVKMVDLSGDTLTRPIDFSPSWRYFLSSMFQAGTDEVQYTFDENNNGILSVESFQPLSLSIFKKKIDAFFKEVQARNCTSVFIDLRNNLGGLLRAEEYLFSYINTRKTAIQTNYLYKRSDYDRFAQLSPMQQMQFENRAKNVYPQGLISKEYDFYQLPKGATHTILYDYVPENNLNYTYKGQCHLILNGNSMSASVLFAAWYKHIDRGPIIGTTCMGGMGGTFGNPAIISLSNSGIDVMASTLKFTPLHIRERDLNPIEPNIILKATRADIIEQRDPLLEFLKSYQK